MNFVAYESARIPPSLFPSRGFYYARIATFSAFFFFPIFNIQLARTMNIHACNPSWSVKTRQS